MGASRSSTSNATVEIHDRRTNNDIIRGFVDNIDPENYTMRVRVTREADDNPDTYTVTIGNNMTSYGAGFKMLPIPNRTGVLIRENYGGYFEHIGYDIDRIKEITDDLSGEKQDQYTRLLQRSLEPGDVQMAGTFGNEVYLSIDGNILIKSQMGVNLKLDDAMHRLEGNFANLKYEMDGVRIRAGNVIRPTMTDTTDDQYMLLDVDNKVKAQDLFIEGDAYYTIPEFTVQVGTYPLPPNYTDDPTISPTVGKFSIAERIIDEEGSALFSAGKAVQCQLRMANGGGFSVTEDGSFYVEDFVTYSPIKFDNNASTAERSLRVRNNYISISTTDDNSAEFTTEIAIKHESNSAIILDNQGILRLQDKNGRYFEINKYGSVLDVTGAQFTVHAKDVVIIPEVAVTIGYALNPLDVDGVPKLTELATLFDSHTHAGPSGFPVPNTLIGVPWLNYIFIPGNKLAAQNLKVV